MRIRMAIVLIMLALLALTGCQPTTAEVEAAFCEDLAAFDAALAELEALPDSATLEEVDAAHAEVRSAWDDLTEAARDLGEIRLDGVEASVTALEGRVDEAPTQPRVTEAVVTVKQSANGVRRAVREVFSTVDCEA